MTLELHRAEKRLYVAVHETLAEAERRLAGNRCMQVLYVSDMFAWPISLATVWMS